MAVVEHIFPGGQSDIEVRADDVAAEKAEEEEVMSRKERDGSSLTNLKEANMVCEEALADD